MNTAAQCLVIVCRALLAFPVIVGASGCVTVRSPGASAPYSTPPGITLVDEQTATQFLWRRFGDANGKPLYTSDHDSEVGKPACIGECAKDFRPYVAPRGAVAFSDWTIVARGDGIRQWAYQNQPLYLYSGDDPSGAAIDASGTFQAYGKVDDSLMDPASKRYAPKDGWRRAAYTPNKTTPTPADISLQSLPTSNGYGLVSSQSGLVAYILTSRPQKPALWRAIYAPAIGVAIGDFSIAALNDGMTQWTYKGQHLFTFAGDYSPTDRNGLLADKNAQVALVAKHFMPSSMDIQVAPARGPLMVTKQGLSVYTQTRFVVQYGSLETRDGYRVPYAKAKAVGTRGCVGECTRLWRPVFASGHEQSSGFWEVVTRADHTKQWAYKGSPLYTFAGDRQLGDVGGNDRYTPTFGDAEGRADLSVSGGDDAYGEYRKGAGLYWHLCGLVY
jgi:predicted lipoprotein with Yx(FWY)xxD motif